MIKSLSTAAHKQKASGLQRTPTRPFQSAFCFDGVLSLGFISKPWNANSAGSAHKTDGSWEGGPFAVV